MSLQFFYCTLTLDLSSVLIFITLIEFVMSCTFLIFRDRLGSRFLSTLLVDGIASRKVLFSSFLLFLGPIQCRLSLCIKRLHVSSLRRALVNCFVLLCCWDHCPRIKGMRGHQIFGGMNSLRVCGPSMDCDEPALSSLAHGIDSLSTGPTIYPVS